MFFTGRISCYWPGLASAWHRGNTTSLAVALLACWFFIWLLLASFVWPQWMPVYVVRSLWLTGVGGWIVASARSHWTFSSLIQASKPLVPDDEYMQAQSEYLTGNYFEAEEKLLRILHDYPRDAESQLLLIGVLRHTQRFQAAMRRISALESWDSAARWTYEISSEKRLIEKRMSQANPKMVDQQPTPSELLR
jgi:hypothetical protein